LIDTSGLWDRLVIMLITEDNFSADYNQKHSNVSRDIGGYKEAGPFISASARVQC